MSLEFSISGTGSVEGDWFKFVVTFSVDSSVFIFSPLVNCFASSGHGSSGEHLESSDNDSSDLSDELKFLVSVDSCEFEDFVEVSAHFSGIIKKLLVSLDLSNCRVESESLDDSVLSQGLF